MLVEERMDRSLREPVQQMASHSPLNKKQYKSLYSYCQPHTLIVISHDFQCHIACGKKVWPITDPKEGSKGKIDPFCE